MGMAQPLVEEALKNIQLKLSAKFDHQRLAKAASALSSTKNEVRFLGGDAQLNADEVGGDARRRGKTPFVTILCPQRTLVPITELVRVFAGPNDGEQCPSHRVVNEIHQRAKCSSAQPKK